MSLPSVLHVDVAVIGAGTAGLAAFRAARERSLRAVLVGEPPFGTTCARVGCMPSKVLLSAAKKAQAARTLMKIVASEPQDPPLDTVAILCDVRAKRDHFVSSVKDGMADFGDDALIEGRATFLDAQRLEVELSDGGRQAITADRLVIATGSSPVVLPGFEHQPNVLTTDTLFELERLPKQPIIIGDGAIALECAFALSQLGSDVTLLGHGGPIGGLSDAAIDQAARDVLLSNVNYISDQSDLQLVEAGVEGVTVQFDQEGVKKRTGGDAVLLAVGRKPNTTSLNVEAAGLELDDDRVPKRNPLTGQTSRDHIFIAGDATGTDTVLHIASGEGEHTGENASHAHVWATTEQPMLRIMFTEPGIAVVGSSRGALENANRAYVVGEVDFSEQGRAIVEDRNAGRLHVYACPKSGAVLGAEMVAPDAEHLAHLIVAAMKANWTVSDFLAMPFYHPTTQEGLRTALRNAQHKLQHATAPLDNSLDIAAGC